jgi:hypothetical protein
MEEPLVQNWDLFRSTENEANSASEKNTVLFKGGHIGDLIKKNRRSQVIFDLQLTVLWIQNLV